MRLAVETVPNCISFSQLIWKLSFFLVVTPTGLRKSSFTSYKCIIKWYLVMFLPSCAAWYFYLYFIICDHFIFNFCYISIQICYITFSNILHACTHIFSLFVIAFIVVFVCFCLGLKALILNNNELNQLPKLDRLVHLNTLGIQFKIIVTKFLLVFCLQSIMEECVSVFQPWGWRK